MISDKLPDFSGLPRVQKSSTADLFLGFGLKRNSATNSLQISSFYINPTIPIRVQISGQNIIQQRNKQPLSIQQITGFFKDLWLYPYILDLTGFQTKPREKAFAGTTALPPRCGKISSMSAMFLSIFTYY